MPPTLEELTLAQVQRALDSQERSFAELRQRTGTLVAAAGLVGPLIVELAPPSRLDVWTFAALACLASTLAISLSVLWPRRLTFALDPGKLYEELWEDRQDVAVVQRRIADVLWRARTQNLDSIDPLHHRYAMSVGFLGAAVVLGTVGVLA